MKKKKEKNKQQKAPMNKNTKTLIFALAGLIALAVIILIIVESFSGRIIIKNETDIKLEYVKAYFVDMEGPFTQEILFEDLEKGDTAEFELEKIDFSYREANLEVRFKFEDYDEMFVDSGYFNEDFNGKILINFTDIDEDKVLLKVKASGGILPSPNIICNEEHVVNLEEGYVEE